MDDIKSCFVIGPIGAEGTDIRDKADWVFHIVEEAIGRDTDQKWKIERSDKIDIPGMITDQIILKVIESDLVIADLTRHNANAFYELALRHMAQKPVVHIIEKGEILPFDVGTYRTVFYDIKNPQTIKNSVDQLYAQYNSIVHDQQEISNPVTQALGIKRIDSVPEGNSIKSVLEEIVQEVSSLRNKVEYLESKDEGLWLKSLYENDKKYKLIKNTGKNLVSNMLVAELVESNRNEKE